ncbi:hypothetical protein PM082_021586 [Marasmius tenuissimus]|nr:hypothetical protein PM082_021586 [Marasmius tenuissimus]
MIGRVQWSETSFLIHLVRIGTHAVVCAPAQLHSDTYVQASQQGTLCSRKEDNLPRRCRLSKHSLPDTDTYTVGSSSCSGGGRWLVALGSVPAASIEEAHNQGFRKIEKFISHTSPQLKHWSPLIQRHQPFRMERWSIFRNGFWDWVVLLLIASKERPCPQFCPRASSGADGTSIPVSPYHPWMPATNPYPGLNCILRLWTIVW